MTMKRILFVCTGNSCRSVMAKGIMEHALQQAGIQGVSVESAGLFAIEGMSATPETQRVLQGIGVDASAHRARSVTVDMIERADLMFVMEQFQAEHLIRRVPSANPKVHLLKAYGLPRGAAGDSPDIGDPIGKPLEVYEVCFAVIREAVERVVRSLEALSA